MGRLIMRSVVMVAMSGALSYIALAGNPPGTGQPNQECEGTTPGRSASGTGRGSAFNENGVAGTVYANPYQPGWHLVW